MADLSEIMKYVRPDAHVLVRQRETLFSSIKSHIELLERGLEHSEQQDYEELLAECEGEDPGYFNSLRRAHDFVHESMFDDGDPAVGQLRLMAAYSAVTMVGAFVETSLAYTCDVVREFRSLSLAHTAFSGGVPRRYRVFLEEYAGLGPFPMREWSQLRHLYELRNEVVHRAGRVQLEGSTNGALDPKNGGLKELVRAGHVQIARPDGFGDPQSDAPVLIVSLEFCLEMLQSVEQFNREVLVSARIAPGMWVCPSEHERLQVN